MPSPPWEDPAGVEDSQVGAGTARGRMRPRVGTGTRGGDVCAPISWSLRLPGAAVAALRHHGCPWWPRARGRRGPAARSGVTLPRGQTCPHRCSRGTGSARGLSALRTDTSPSPGLGHRAPGDSRVPAAAPAAPHPHPPPVSTQSHRTPKPLHPKATAARCPLCAIPGVLVAARMGTAVCKWPQISVATKPQCCLSWGGVSNLRALHHMGSHIPRVPYPKSPLS